MARVRNPGQPDDLFEIDVERHNRLDAKLAASYGYQGIVEVEDSVRLPHQVQHARIKPPSFERQPVYCSIGYLIEETSQQLW